MTIDLDVGTLAALATLAAFVGAGLRGMYRMARKLDELNDLASRELEHNHGSSMKDDLHGLAVAVGQQQRQLDDLDTRLDNVAYDVRTLKGTRR